MFYIYILFSHSSNLYYVGYSTDVDLGVRQHNESGQGTFTSKHRPWVLKGVFSCGEDRALAMRIEKFIKKQKSKSFIEALLSGVPLTGILAQLVRVPHVRD
ncbi:MAG TPA: GIY-YIG nuclease family protein [Cyclobacteriaceae bacterium]|nr:GIY-YIG nuclease family protein [Cyclobacteriaceae bacterium]